MANSIMTLLEIVQYLHELQLKGMENSDAYDGALKQYHSQEAVSSEVDIKKVQQYMDTNNMYLTTAESYLPED